MCHADDWSALRQIVLEKETDHAMPLTIKEVLETLEDPVALGIEFYAFKIHVNGDDLSRVHERIVVGDILVTGGVK